MTFPFTVDPVEQFSGTFKVNVTIIDDSLLESIELFTLSLVLVDSGGPKTEIEILEDKARITIVDNDVKIQFENEIVNVTEKDETVTICLEKMGVITTFSTVRVFSCGHETLLKTAVSDGSGMDYDEVDVEVTFESSDVIKCIDVTITDDEMVEMLEAFGVCVEVVTTNVEIGPKDRVTIIIIDDDSELPLCFVEAFVCFSINYIHEDRCSVGDMPWTKYLHYATMILMPLLCPLWRGLKGSPHTLKSLYVLYRQVLNTTHTLKSTY